MQTLLTTHKPHRRRLPQREQREQRERPRHLMQQSKEPQLRKELRLHKELQLHKEEPFLNRQAQAALTLSKQHKAAITPTSSTPTHRMTKP